MKYYRYKAIASRFYKGVDGVILVYDITSEESYNKVDSWVEQAKENTTKDLPFILVGNKSDLDDQRQVKYAEGEKLSNKLNWPFFEVSALSKENIDSVFEKMVEIILPKKLKQKKDRDDMRATLKNSKKAKQKDGWKW